MFEFDDFIGKDVESATEILKQNGENKIKVIENSKHNEKCDTLLVCKAEKVGEVVMLVCGEFCVNMEDKNVI